MTLLSGRVAREDGSASPEFDHLALLVDLDEPWLADVGFGDSFLEPLRLKDGDRAGTTQRSFPYRSSRGRDDCAAPARRAALEVAISIHLEALRLEDFEARCQFQQISPESHFTRQRVCTLRMPDGRITLSDLTLIRTVKNHREEQMLNSEEEWRGALVEYFGVRL